MTLVIRNSAILASLPINRSLKNYFVRKFLYLRRHNGDAFASEVFKTMKEVVMRYLDDENRLENQSIYIADCPVKNKRRVKQLLRVADSQPYEVIDLLKIYTQLPRPTEDKVSFKNSFKAVLDLTPQLDVGTSDYLTRLLMTGMYGNMRLSKNQATKLNSMADLTYAYYIPTRYDYANNVIRYWRDQDCLREFVRKHGDVSGTYSPIKRIMSQMSLAEAPTKWSDPLAEIEWKQNATNVGEIVLIPKSGTTTWRPIGYANRFFNSAFVPLQSFFYSLLENLPGDHTRDQSRSDAAIQRRLNKGLFVASVDLSKATEFMPIEPLERAMNSIFTEFGLGVTHGMDHLTKDTVKFLEASFEDYRRFCRSDWLFMGSKVSWMRGQALGSQPSFGALALTHNLIILGLCKTLGISTDTYTVLGDDVVFFDARLRDSYIQVLDLIGSPISRHKSFDGRITEFAGKLFIRNHRTPRYISDHNPLTYNTLFDYQKATKVSIPWNRLPNSLRRKWADGFSDRRTAKRYYEAITAYVTDSIPADAVASREYVDVVISDCTSVHRMSPSPPLKGATATFDKDGRIFMSDRPSVYVPSDSWYRNKVGVPPADVIKSELLRTVLPSRSSL